MGQVDLYLRSSHFSPVVKTPVCTVTTIQMKHFVLPAVLVVRNPSDPVQGGSII